METQLLTADAGTRWPMGCNQPSNGNATTETNVHPHSDVIAPKRVKQTNFSLLLSGRQDMDEFHVT